MTTTAAAAPLEGATPGDGTPIIETLGLTKTYSGTDFRAVDDLSLRVGSGEVFGLLGPNGAGKTTTIGVLTTRVIPTGGQALIGGIDVVQHPTLVKQLIGVVSQQNTLDRLLTPFENLYWHGRLFGMGAKESRQTAEDLLERFQLTRFAKASVYALSGGMAQRLMVARAIFHRPAVLFLDEPTAGLDPQGRLALWDLLEGLNADGQTIMLTTHYMEEADKLCDRLAIMDHGKILALGTPTDLKRSVGGGHGRHGQGCRRPRRTGRGLQGQTRRTHQDRAPCPTGSSCRFAVRIDSSPGWLKQPRRAGSHWPTCPWPNPHSRPSSSG